MNEQIIEIEKKLAFQEDAIEQLNQVIVDQESRIKKLERELVIMRNLMSDEEFVKPQEEEEPPPHY